MDRSALVKKVLVEGLQQERLNFAIQKYMMKDISIERVAEIAKLSIHEFISNLSKLGVPSNLTIEEIEKII